MDSFKKSFAIQLRVLGALVMREILTRYGRHNLGFLWLFVEPAIFTLGIVVLWSFTKAHTGNISIVAFAVTGYSYVLMWRNATSRCAHAIEPNLSLMYHRNVKVIDFFISRLVLEFAGITISFITLSFVFYMLGLMPAPHDVFMMLEAWLLLILFSIGLGLIIGVVSEISEVFDRIWHTFTYLFFPMSGSLFFVDSLPTHIQKLILYVPPLHAIEQLRHGYYGPIVKTYEDPMYLFSVSIVLIFLGLCGVFWIKDKVQPE